MISRFVSLFCALFALALLNACATTLEATTDFDQQFDFSPVRKLAILPVDRASLSTIKVSDMQIARVDEALRSELERKGFEVVSDTAAADAFITWHLVTEERTDVRTYNSMSYYNCWRCGPNVSDVSVRQYTQGTFIVDLIDPVRNRSVWRSVIESRLQSEPDPGSAESAQRRAEAARAVFDQFPPA
jgi:hypothetical protein